MGVVEGVGGVSAWLCTNVWAYGRARAVRGTYPTLSMCGHRPSISVLATSLPGEGTGRLASHRSVRSGGIEGGGEGVECPRSPVSGAPVYQYGRWAIEP